MNLSTLLRILDIRERFTAEFQKRRIVIDRPVLVPPQSKRCSLVGTAFDYLLRFHIQRMTAHARIRRWVAEASLGHIETSAISRTVIGIDTGDVSFPEDDGTREIGQRVLADTRKAHERFMKDGIVRPALLKGVIHLAQLDAAYRSGFMYEDENLGVAAPEDVRDLRDLISIVPWEAFGSKYRCLLNPTFAVESKVSVFGADADLVLDDLLIDIKAVKHASFDREVFNQLIGYYTLHRIGGFNGDGRNRKIQRLGTYFARHGHLLTIEVDSVINRKTFPAFVRWFSKRLRLLKRRPRKSAPRRRLKGKRFSGRVAA
jgi:hypothetical protein